MSDAWLFREGLLLALAGLAWMLWPAKNKATLQTPATDVQEPAAPSDTDQPRSYRVSRGVGSGRRRGLVLASLAVAAMLAWLGAARIPASPDYPLDPGKIHVHEWTHYYLGAKYANELSYTRLYICIDTADAQDGHRAQVARRPIRNLQTGAVEGSTAILTHPQECTRHFTPARWNEFRHDVRFFEARVHPQQWNAILVDHGYNPTPVWTTLGRLLANHGPVSVTEVELLALLDPLFLLAMVLAIGWAFGRRAAAVSLLVLGVFLPAAHSWTGGAFLRWDWLLWTVAAVCLLKKNHPLCAGLALGYSACLRIFPAILFAGPLFAFLWQVLAAWRNRPTHLVQTIARPQRPPAGEGLESAVGRWWAMRFLAGGAAATALLVTVSGILVGGLGTWRAFYHNLARIQQDIMTNQIGVLTVLRWRPHQGLHELYQAHAVDATGTWRHTVAHEAATMRPIALLLALVALAALAWAARRVPPWIALVLGITVIPTLTDPLNYYYMIIVVLALLWTDRPRIGAWLLALAAASQFVALAPLPGMPGPDQQFTLISALTVPTFAAILWHYARHPIPSVPPGTPPPHHGGEDLVALTPPQPVPHS
ncbi:hypothetical protein [Streptomyces sp. NPDC047028]|uniref:hypothetical protein n=1 Tax=Streptomyces sp. NPDC047028 TaxID=3155793 RepID=UPI0033FE5A3A